MLEYKGAKHDAQAQMEVRWGRLVRLSLKADAWERARELLKRIEWSGVRIDVYSDPARGRAGDRSEVTAACPSCGACGVPREPHRSRCELAALIEEDT